MIQGLCVTNKPQRHLRTIVWWTSNADLMSLYDIVVLQLMESKCMILYNS